jgi:hypothetical protein
MTRPFRLACVLICLASMGLTISGAAERMLQAEVPGEEMSTSTIASHEALRLRIRQLAAELGSTAEPRPVAERLRAAAAAYLMGLEKEQGSGASGSLEGRRSAQPIPSGQLSGGARDPRRPRLRTSSRKGRSPCQEPIWLPRRRRCGRGPGPARNPRASRSSSCSDCWTNSTGFSRRSRQPTQARSRASPRPSRRSPPG